MARDETRSTRPERRRVPSRERVRRRQANRGEAPLRETPPPPPTIATMLTGMRDLGGQVGQVAVTVVRGSIKTAGQIGADLGRLAVTVADGAIETADRIATAAAGMIARQRGAPASASAPRRREPWPAPVKRDAIPHPDDLPASPDAYARRAEASPVSARKPPARNASRRQKRPAPKRRRGAA
jgi:hypothetical protein